MPNHRRRPARRHARIAADLSPSVAETGGRACLSGARVTAAINGAQAAIAPPPLLCYRAIASWKLDADRRSHDAGLCSTGRLGRWRCACVYAAGAAVRAIRCPAPVARRPILHVLPQPGPQDGRSRARHGERQPGRGKHADMGTGGPQASQPPDAALGLKTAR